MADGNGDLNKEKSVDGLSGIPVSFLCDLCEELKNGLRRSFVGGAVYVLIIFMVFIKLSKCTNLLSWQRLAWAALDLPHYGRALFNNPKTIPGRLLRRGEPTPGDAIHGAKRIGAVYR